MLWQINAHGDGEDAVVVYFRNARDNPRELEETNWWETSSAHEGYLYLSFNAGAFRLLLPPEYEHLIERMSGARYVEVTRGPWEEFGIEDSVSLVWDEGANEPIEICLSDYQFDHIPYRHDVQIGICVTVLCRTGKLGSWNARFVYKHRHLVADDTCAMSLQYRGTPGS